MAEQNPETETQQVSLLAPQEPALTPAVELEDEMEAQPVGPNSPPNVSSLTSTEQKDIDLQEKFESGESELEPVECELPPSRQDTYLQEEASRAVSDASSVNPCCEALPEEVSQREASDGSISPHPADEDMGVDQETDFAGDADDILKATDFQADEGVDDVDVMPSNSGETSEMIERDESQSLQEIVPIEVGRSQENPPEIENTDTTVAAVEDSCSPQAISEPEVDPVGEESQSSQNLITEEQATSRNQPVLEPQLVRENMVVEEDVQACSLGDQDPVAPSVITPESLTAALIGEDTSSSQDLIKDPVEPSAVTPESVTAALIGEDTSSSQDFFKDPVAPSAVTPESVTAALIGEDTSSSQDFLKNPVASNAVTPESVTAALIGEDTSASQGFLKDDASQVKPLTTLDAATDASGRSTPNIELLKDLAGRDSPSVRSLKGDSGRDSPSQRSRRRIGRDSVVTEANEANMGIFPAENLFEYQWPQEKGAEWYFVQEQVSEFMQVKSFKRKYPDLERRVMDIHEKEFLRERGVVTEEQVTLGLTALRADEVYDLMLKDAPDKSAEYARVLHEKEKQNISNKHKQYEAPSVDSNKVQEYVKKAVRQAAEYNSALMAERKEERQYYFDMQTLTVQMPASRMKRPGKDATKLGPYPVAVIPGQYQNYYRSYSSDELKYFPLNTSLYGPMAPRRQTDLAPPVTNDEPDQLSDNDTVMSIENFDSSSDVSDRDQATPMDIDSHDNVELDAGEDRTASITLPNDSCSYKPVAVRELEPCVVVGLQRPKDIPNAICGLCLKDSSENKLGVSEKMIHCSQCDNSGHPSCLDMTPTMVEIIQTYPWQCMECKTCFHCGDPTHEDKMMFCDMCDRGYHTFCVGLQDIPTGLWACESCQLRDVPAALAPHVPTPPLPPTPPPAEAGLGEQPPSPHPAESTPSNKKKGRRSATPVSGTKQSTPGMKRSKTCTPTPKRVRKK